MTNTASGAGASTPYRETTAGDFAARYTSGLRIVSADADVAVFSGRCPRCGCDFTYTHTGRVFRSPRRAPSPAQVPVICTCTADHPGRPPGEEGCGAYWNIILERA
ncbi:hypothetical protein ABZ876_16440 [Streptomyces sp. NPDC046931]|uniref:hypothetical protein n=1 Tax=Streptomyces sp. NPDC046931 TaxID=3154806 RepID=UPI0033EEB959